ncbi:MAG: heavy metal-associated domain-containing protein [Bacteroidota bacterium]
MKKILAITIYLVFQAAQGQSEPIPVKGGYKVEIQTSAICELCKETLEKDLVFEKGVKAAFLDLETKKMMITYNPKKTSAASLRKRITMVGYHADTLARNPDAYSKLPFCCKDGSHGTPIPQVPLPSKMN